MKKSAVVLAVGFLLVSPAGAAIAAPPPTTPTVLAQGFVTPLHLSVGPSKAVTVSEEFAGELARVADGTTSIIYSAPGWDVGGSDTKGSTTYFVQSQGPGPDATEARPLAGSLMAIDAKGAVRTVTDQLAAYEIAHNPDRNLAYGVSATASAECVAQLQAVGASGPYQGTVDSHPYAVAVWGNTAYIADAGGNDLLAVNLTTGAIRTVAVLPGRTITITDELAQGMGVPACAGQTYTLEGVPTDVVVGTDGWLYVSSLPGGPEDGSLGANGAVYRVSPASGVVQPWVEGLLSPTGLAVDGSGNLYIASLFGGGIYRVPAGTRTPQLFLAVPTPADVTVSGSTLYATTDVFGSGTLVSLKL